MKQYSISLAVAVMTAAMTLVSCSSDDLDDQMVGQGERVIRLKSTLQATRGTADLQSGTQLASGMQVGAFGLSGGAAVTNGLNNKYTADGSGGLTTSQDMSSADGAATIYAYAPYQSSWTSHDSAMGFSVSTDQSSAANYLASDLLYATATATSGSAGLSFTHKLARVCLTLTNSTGADLTGVTVKILGTRIATTLKLSDGSLGNAAGEASDVTLAGDVSIVAGGSQTVYGIVVPQTIAAKTQLFSIQYGEKTITWKDDSAPVVFASGNVYQAALDIKMNTVSGTISSATVPGL